MSFDPPGMMKLADVPAYVEAKTGQVVTRQTVYNWRKYGKQGRKLTTLKIVKGYYTTEVWVDEFLSNTA